MINFLKRAAFGALLAAVAFLGIAPVLSPAMAQVASMPISANGQPIDTLPPNHICAGPTASIIEDCRKITGLAYASGGCTTTPVIVGSPDAFKLTNGASGCSGSTMVLTLPAAANNWVCQFHDITTATTYDEETTSTTTSVTLTNYTRTTGVALTWVASDVILGSCASL